MPHYDVSGYHLNRRSQGRGAQRQSHSPAQDHVYAGLVLPQRLQTPTRPVHARQRQTKSGRFGAALIVLLATLVGAICFGVVWIDSMYVGRMYPHVMIAGVALGGRTLPEAEQVVRSRVAPLLKQPITLKLGDRSWQPTAEEIGLSLDLDQLVADAYDGGRRSRPLANAWHVLFAPQKPVNLPLPVNIDKAKLDAYLQKVAADVDQPPREAELTIVDNAIQSSSIANGRVLLVDQAAAEIVQALRTLEPQEVTLQTRVVEPQVSRTAIDEANRSLGTILSAPIELVFKEQTFTLGVNTIRDMLTVQQKDGAVHIHFDQARLHELIKKNTNHLKAAPVEPRLDWNNGDLKIAGAGSPGWQIDVDRAVQLIGEVAMTPSRRVELPTKPVEPVVTEKTLDQLGITELVASGKSGFEGSQEYRITNIKAGVKVLDGLLIPPGEEFSFNKAIGEISHKLGFVEGYAIIGDRTQKEIGGGICQDSTTLFRAAFYAGLPITAWTPHRFRLDWYEKYDPIGMDAAIYTEDGPDLRFVNDTGNWLLIEGRVDDGTATVTFDLYGTKVPGRSVERTEPLISNVRPAPKEPVYINDESVPLGEFFQTDQARDGMDIEIRRIVKQAGKEDHVDTFLTRFEPWPNIFLKHPDTPKPPVPPILDE